MIILFNSSRGSWDIDLLLYVIYRNWGEIFLYIKIRGELLLITARPRFCCSIVSEDVLVFISLVLVTMISFSVSENTNLYLYRDN